MAGLLSSIGKNRWFSKSRSGGERPHTLAGGAINHTYTVKEIRTDDQEMVNFLFTLGCYEGEEVTVISHLASNYVISIKDARYSIDSELAKAIVI